MLLNLLIGLGLLSPIIIMLVIAILVGPIDDHDGGYPGGSNSQRER